VKEPVLVVLAHLVRAKSESAGDPETDQEHDDRGGMEQSHARRLRRYVRLRHSLPL
jgi:hypothetical protein